MRLGSRLGARNPHTDVVTGSEFVGRFGRRLSARLIDVSLEGIFFIFFLSMAEFAIAPIGASEPLKGMLIVPYAAMTLLLIYEPLAIALTGRTLGKKIMGIGVRSRGNVGQVPTLQQSAVRWAIPAILGTALFLLIIVGIRQVLPQRGDEATAVLEYAMGGSLRISDYIGLWLLSNAAFFGVIVGTPFGFAVLAMTKPSPSNEQRAWHDCFAGTTVIQLRVGGGAQPAVAPPPTPLSSRWKRFRDELRSGALRQYEADAEMRPYGASPDGHFRLPERTLGESDADSDDSPAASP